MNLYQFGTLSLKEIKPKMINGIATYDQEASAQADLFGKGKAGMTIAYYNEYEQYKFKGELCSRQLVLYSSIEALIYMCLMLWAFDQVRQFGGGVEYY